MTALPAGNLFRGRSRVEAVVATLVLFGMAGGPLAAGASAAGASPAGGTLVVVGLGEGTAQLFATGTVSLVGTTSDMVLKTDHLAAPSYAVGVSPAGTTAYVLASGNDDGNTPGAVVPVGVVTGAPGRAIPAGPDPVAISVNPNGRAAYVVNGFDAATTPVGTPGTVTPIDTVDASAGRPIHVGPAPFAASVTPNGRTLYVLDSNANQNYAPLEVTPVDLATSKAQRPVRVPASAIAITPDSRTAYLLDPSQLSVVPLDTVSEVPGRAIGLGSDVPEALAISPDGRTLYVVGTPSPGLGGKGGDAVVPINTATNTAGRPIPIGSHPGVDAWTIGFSPDGRTAYVLGDGSASVKGVVVPIATASGVVGRSIGVGLEASALVVSANGERVYVLDQGVDFGPGSKQGLRGGILPISAANGAVGPLINVGPYPQAMVIASP